LFLSIFLKLIVKKILSDKIWSLWYCPQEKSYT